MHWRACCSRPETRSQVRKATCNLVRHPSLRLSIDRDLKRGFVCLWVQRAPLITLS
jgi:hypothetical protein